MEKGYALIKSKTHQYFTCKCDTNVRHERIGSKPLLLGFELTVNFMAFSGETPTSCGKRPTIGKSTFLTTNNLINQQHSQGIEFL